MPRQKKKIFFGLSLLTNQSRSSRHKGRGGCCCCMHLYVICKVARKQTDENDELVFAHMTENLQSWTGDGFAKEQRKCRV